MLDENFELPLDFTNRMKNMLGQNWDSFFKSYRENNYHGLRINHLKKSMTEPSLTMVFENLSMDHPKEIPWAIDGYFYEDSCHPGKHPYHEMGLYYIQEPSAMSAAALLAPKPGDRVLDLCAAPGGKSTQLASYLKQEGILISNEINNGRCKILAQNIERLGMSNVIVTNEDSKDLADHLPAFFHKILVDAPCSGEGMFRKNPEACKEWSLENVEICAKRQLMILDNADIMLMAGGTMVYSTCTFAKEENEEVIYQFLLKHPEYTLIYKDVPQFSEGNPDWIDEKYLSPELDKEEMKKTYRLWPHKLEGEGHFAAILFKGDPSSVIDNDDNELLSYSFDKPDKKGKSKTKKTSWGDKEQEKLLLDFLASTLSLEMQEFILNGKLTLFGDQLYRLPDQSPSIKGLKVLRAGLHIGTFKKNRFEPSHALALFLGKEYVKASYNLSLNDSRVKAYFNGESISVESKNGWCLLLVDNFSAGWGKVNNNILKNHYPKGLRLNSF